VKLKYILMSIKPVFAEEILRGRKKFEVRARVSGISSGDRVIIYASAPVKAIVGEFTAGRIIIGSGEAMWRFLTSGDYGISSLDEPYIKPKRRVMAIEVLNPRRYRNPITLSEIRQFIPEFMPPISFIELKSELLRLLMELIKSKNA